jgi:hypothetical protein
MEMWLEQYTKQLTTGPPKGKGKGSKQEGSDKRRKVQGSDSGHATLLTAVLAVGDLALDTARS